MVSWLLDTDAMIDVDMGNCIRNFDAVVSIVGCAKLITVHPTVLRKLQRCTNFVAMIDPRLLSDYTENVIYPAGIIDGYCVYMDFTLHDDRVYLGVPESAVVGDDGRMVLHLS